MPLLYAVVNSGSVVSGDVDLTKYGLSAIGVPTITSGDLLLQGNFDTTSGNFYRLQHTRPNSDVRFAVGPGSAMILWPMDVPTPPYVRLETAVSQTDVRTFTVLVR